MVAPVHGIGLSERIGTGIHAPAAPALNDVYRFAPDLLNPLFIALSDETNCHTVRNRSLLGRPFITHARHLPNAEYNDPGPD